jgi:hypothetical protein
VPHVDPWQVVKYWTEKWTEVPRPSFSKTQILYAIQIKTQIPKIKIVKTHMLKRYLTLINIKTMGISNFYRKIDYVRAERRLRGAFGFLSRMEAGCVVKY